MKLQTFLSLVGVEIEPALVRLPSEYQNQLSVGTLREDGDVDLIATRNLEGRELSAARKGTVLRLLQLIGEACASNDRGSLVILPRQDAPCIIAPAEGRLAVTG